MNIQLDAKHKKIIDSLLIRFPYAFFVFGSRAKQKAHQKSDLDLCIKDEISLEKYAHIKEALQNLLLPFSIDLVLWSTLSDSFKEQIKKDLIRYTIDPLLGADIVELSHVIAPQTPVWPGGFFEIEKKSDYEQQFCVQKYSFSAGFGTHIDAPAHKIPGGMDLALIPLKASMPTTCFVFYPQEKVVAADFLLTRLMIENFEKQYGEITPDSWFLLMSSWGEKAFNNTAYCNINRFGQMEFPGISIDAAEYLVEKKIRGFGIDTLSPDCMDKDFSVHTCFLSANIIILENIKYIKNLLPASGFLQVVPLAINGGTESPARVFFYNH
jgi:kynurenine formamidase/predicted nucleotidyltransferase